MLTSTILGALDPTTQAQVEAFARRPESTLISDTMSFLQLYQVDRRAEIGVALVSAGVSVGVVSRALEQLASMHRPYWRPSPLYSVLATVSAAASGYHGLRRNNGSIGWGAVWFFLGGLFPVLVPVVAWGQGFAKPKKG